MAQGRYLSRSVKEDTASMAAVGEESAAGEISTVSLKPYVLTSTEIFLQLPSFQRSPHFTCQHLA